MFCPRCKTEYPAGEVRCADCNEALVEELPAEQPAEGSSGEFELTEVASFGNVSEAKMVHELHEKNGIRTVLRGETDPIGATSGAEPTTLLVEERDGQRARELYDAYFSQPIPEDESTPERQ